MNLKLFLLLLQIRLIKCGKIIREEYSHKIYFHKSALCCVPSEARCPAAAHEGDRKITKGSKTWHLATSGKPSAWEFPRISPNIPEEFSRTRVRVGDRGLWFQGRAMQQCVLAECAAQPVERAKRKMCLIKNQELRGFSRCEWQQWVGSASEWAD